MTLLGQLGCGDYSARIVTRGALAVAWEEIPFTSLSYARVLDDTSEATIQIDGIDPGCALKTRFAAVRSWQHELAIYRAGSIVWIGPVVGRSGQGTGGKITARDRSVWWDHRFLHASWNATADLATIFKAYFDDAMSVDPVAGFICNPTPTSINGLRLVDALDHKAAGPEMRELSALGIDWTVIATICQAGGKTVPGTTRLPVLSDDHLRSDPSVEAIGLSQVNRQVVTGQQPQDTVTGQFIEGPRVYGEYTDATRRSRDGLLESNVQDDRAYDVNSAAAGAQSIVALNGDEPVVVSSLDLAPNAPMTLAQLIPGALADVELVRPALSVSGIYRLQKATVTVDNNGERVSIDVQPVGST